MDTVLGRGDKQGWEGGGGGYYGIKRTQNDAEVKGTVKYGIYNKA